MAGPQKIATCCYCGTRAALQLRGKTRHELTCSNCGAPLHDLKMLPKKKMKGDRELVRPSRVRQPQPPRRRKKSKAKRLWDFVEDAFDVIEDILD